MAKRGRPRKNGVQPSWMFFRTALVIYEYNRLRSSGMKQALAVTETVARLRKTQPDMPISPTEVKRILASYQPKDRPSALKVTPVADSSKTIPPEMCDYMGIPRGTLKKNRLAFGFGQRPKYPRINAKVLDSSETEK